MEAAAGEGGREGREGAAGGGGGGRERETWREQQGRAGSRAWRWQQGMEVAAGHGGGSRAWRWQQGSGRKRMEATAGESAQQGTEMAAEEGVTARRKCQRRV